jgi:hypothetical protein
MNLSSVMLITTLVEVCSHCILLSAQTLQIKLIDGRNGHLITRTCVNVWVGDERKYPLLIPTDRNGIARLRLTDNDAEVNTDDRWEACGDFGVINPVVKYKSFVKVNVPYALCEPHGRDFSWLEVKHFATEQFVREGFVTPNTCGKPTASAKPGELVIFVRPLSWWEKLKQ